MDFGFYGAALDNTPELELADPESASPDTETTRTLAGVPRRPVASYKQATSIPRTSCSFANAEIFRGHPFYKTSDLGPMLRRLVERLDLKLSG